MANPNDSAEWWGIYEIPDEATLQQQREDEEIDIAWERMYLESLREDAEAADAWLRENP